MSDAGTPRKGPSSARARREHRRQGMLIVSSTGVVLASLAALWVFFEDGAVGRQREAAHLLGYRLGRREAVKPVDVPLTRAERLRTEYLGDPSVPHYFRMLASSLSHTLREPIAALVSHVRNMKTALDKGNDSLESEQVGGTTLMEADDILKRSVLLSLWDLLSAALSRAGEPPRDAGHITSSEAQDLQWWVRHPGIRQVCEIGFNAGHSAAAILLADRKVSLLSIDLGEHRYISEAAELISSLFPGRFNLELGDSVPTFAELGRQGSARCDLTRIDGGHLGTTPAADLSNAMHNAAGPRLVWMDDVGCSNWNCGAPTRAWRHAVDTGLVDEQSCRVEDESHGFCVGYVRQR